MEEGEFPTSFQNTYHVNFNVVEVPSDIKHESECVIITGEGKTVDANLLPIPEPEELWNKCAFQKLPFEYQPNEESYRKAASTWEKCFKPIKSRVILPVPMGFTFKRPVEPHLPNAQDEVDRASTNNKIAEKKFSITDSPLTAVNYMQMADAIINEMMPTDTDFNETGPRNEKIPIQNYFTDKTPWGGQLIPIQPKPQLYETYEEYEASMNRWKNEIIQHCTIPISPSQLQPILGVEKQPQYMRRNKHKGGLRSPSDYLRILSNPSSDFSDDSATQSLLTAPSSLSFQLEKSVNNNLMRIKMNAKPPTNLKDTPAQLIGMNHVYYETLIKQNTRAPHIKLPYPAGLQPCHKLAEEFIAYGPRQPFRHNLIPSGALLDAMHSTFPPVPPLTRVATIDSLLQSWKDPGLKYRLFRELSQDFNDKVGTVRNLVVSSLKTLFGVYNLFGDFSTEIHDRPTLHEIKANQIIEDIQRFVLEWYMCTQLERHFLKDAKCRVASGFFGGRSQLAQGALDAFVNQNSSFIGVKMLECALADPQAAADVLFLILINDSPAIRGLFRRDEFPLFAILTTIAVASEAAFASIRRRIYESLQLSALMVCELASMNYDPYKLLNDSPKCLIEFLSDLMFGRFPKGSVSTDVNWAMLFVTTIISNPSFANEVFFRFAYAICVFVQNRLWADQDNPVWQAIVPPILSIFSASIAASNDADGHAIMLKAMRRLLWHKSAVLYLHETADVVDTLASCISNENSPAAASAIKTLTIILVNHPSFLHDLVGNPKLLAHLGNSLFVRKVELLLEIFKLVLYVCNMPWYTKESSRFTQLLTAMRFRITAATSTVRAVVPPKKEAFFKRFEKFLQEKPQIAQMLAEIDNQFAVRRP